MGLAGLCDHMLSAIRNVALDIGKAAVAFAFGAPNSTPPCKFKGVKFNRLAMSQLLQFLRSSHLAGPKDFGNCPCDTDICVVALTMQALSCG